MSAANLFMKSCMAMQLRGMGGGANSLFKVIFSFVNKFCTVERSKVIDNLLWIFYKTFEIWKINFLLHVRRATTINREKFSVLHKKKIQFFPSQYFRLFFTRIEMKNCTHEIFFINFLSTSCCLSLFFNKNIAWGVSHMKISWNCVKPLNWYWFCYQRNL